MALKKKKEGDVLFVSPVFSRHLPSRHVIVHSRPRHLPCCRYSPSLVMAGDWLAFRCGHSLGAQLIGRPADRLLAGSTVVQDANFGPRFYAPKAFSCLIFRILFRLVRFVCSRFLVCLALLWFLYPVRLCVI